MQDSPAIQAGDARLRAFDTNRAALAVLVGVSLSLFLVIIIVAVAFIVTAQDGVRTLDSDFRVFWASARLFLAGEPLAAFDPAGLTANTAP
jgi:hypothetical protein